MQKSLDEQLTDELFIALSRERCPETDVPELVCSGLGPLPRPSASVTHRCRHYSSSIDSCKTGISLALGITGDKEGDL